MTKKYLIYTDPHWSQYSSVVRKRGKKYSVRLHNLIDSINWLEDLAEELHCNGIIECGDFFDRESLNCEEITALQELCFSNIHHDFIVGNHESNVSDLEFSSTKFFEAMDVTVHDTIYREVINDKVDFYYIPYLTDDRLPKLSDIIVDKSKKNVVFAHLDIAGLQYGMFTSQTGMNIQDILDNCTLFLDGHLHNGQIIEKKIVLIGNLTGQNFNEDATKYEHLVYLLSVNDDGSIVLEPIENPHAINFYKLKIESDNELQQLNHLKNNCVLSIACSNNMKNKILDKIESLPNILEYRLNIFYDSLKTEGENVISKEIDHMQQFIDLANSKFEPSPALTDELLRLRGI